MFCHYALHILDKGSALLTPLTLLNYLSGAEHTDVTDYRRILRIVLEIPQSGDHDGSFPASGFLEVLRISLKSSREAGCPDELAIFRLGITSDYSGLGILLIKRNLKEKLQIALKLPARRGSR